MASHLLKKLLSVASITVALIVTSVIPASAEVLAAASCSVHLQPQMAIGPTIQEHRHWLQMPYAFNGKPYVIINGRTRRSYHWSFWNNQGNVGKFGVPTSYATAFPGWVRDPWILAYEC
jgi:hypothetical protein